LGLVRCNAKCIVVTTVRQGDCKYIPLAIKIQQLEEGSRFTRYHDIMTFA